MSHSINTRISGPAANGDYAIVEPGGIIVGEAFHRVGEDEWRDAKGNARLWAKAPDLRAALEETLENLCHCCRRLNPQHANCTWCSDTEQARAALAGAGEAGDGS